MIHSMSTAGGQSPSQEALLFLLFGSLLLGACCLLGTAFSLLSHAVSPPFLQSIRHDPVGTLPIYRFFFLLGAAFLVAFFFPPFRLAIQSHPLSSQVIPRDTSPGDGSYAITGASDGPSHRRAWPQRAPVAPQCSASLPVRTRKSGGLLPPRNAAPSSELAQGPPP